MDDMKKEWMKSDVDKLINTYRSKPELWDLKSKEYKIKAKKRDALTEIAEKFDTTIEEISRKIHNLRNQYNGELKKYMKKNTGQSTNEFVSKWPYFKSLSFLQGSLLLKSSGNFPREDIKEDIESDEQIDTQDSVVHQTNDVNSYIVDGFLNTVLSTSDDIEKVPRKKQKTEIANQNDMLLRKALHTLSEQGDQYDIFGKYIASEMRNLNSDYLRRKMKRKIHEVIIEINDEEDQFSNN